MQNRFGVSSEKRTRAGHVGSHLEGKAETSAVELEPKAQLAAMKEGAYLRATRIVASQPVPVRDDELPGLINASYEMRFADLDRWIDRRLAAIKTHWKRLLQVPRNRPRNHRRRSEYRKAADMRDTKHYSWAKLALRIDPDAYKREPKKTADRIRKGVKEITNTKGGDEHDSRLLYIPLFFGPRELPDPALASQNAGWPREQFEHATFAFFDVGSECGYTQDAVLEAILDVYLRCAEKVYPGAAARNLLNAAETIFFSERLMALTPADVERTLGEPQARIQDGDKLIYKFDDLTFEFKNGRYHDLKFHDRD